MSVFYFTDQPDLSFESKEKMSKNRVVSVSKDQYNLLHQGD